MAIIVENGQGLANANSYASVADADTYHSDRGNDIWEDLTELQKEQSLIRATDYMEAVYRLRWKGYRHSETQALSFPRDELQREDFTYLNQWSYYPNDEVPKEVKNACIELALKASTQELNPDLTQGVIMEKVDVIQIEYDKYSPQSPRFSAIDNMLQPFFTGSSNSHKVVRV